MLTTATCRGLPTDTLADIEIASQSFAHQSIILMASIHLILVMLRRDHTYQITARKVYRIIFLLQLAYVNVFRNTVFHFSSLFQRWHFASSVVFRQVIGKDKVKVKVYLFLEGIMK